MRKNVLTTFMLAGLFFWTNAQVGINLPDPKVTLHVDKSANPAVADGVLIPRVTITELDSKWTQYNAPQNGVLVFVKEAGTSTQVKTSNISGRGFYYYDAIASLWKAAATGYGNGSFTITPVSVPFTNTNLDWSAYTAYNYFEFYKPFGVATVGSLNFPLPSIFANRTIYIRNFTLANITYVNSGIPNVTTLTNFSSQQFYSDGAKWYLMAGRQ